MGMNGGAERTVWENLAGNRKIQIPGRREDQGVEFRGPGFGESLRAGQSSSGLGLSNAFQFSQEDLAGLMRAF